MLDGAGTLYCEEKTYKLKKGCAFFTRMGVASSYTNDGGLFTAFLTVKGHAIDALCEHYGYGNILFAESTDTDTYIFEDCSGGKRIRG